MRKKDAVKHFKSCAGVARFLGIKRAAVSKWPDIVPEGWASILHLRTGGKVPYRATDYPEYPRIQPSPERLSA
jgi:transcriptional repressor of cell division inhibition gene dicB